MKTYKKTIIFTSILTLLPILAGVYFWESLPETMATHFDFDGVANGWSSKGFAVFGLPIMLLFLHLLCVFCPWIVRKQAGFQIGQIKKTAGSETINPKMEAVFLWTCPAVSLICAALIYPIALGRKNDVGMLVQLLVGSLFMIIGNYLPKCTQNRFVGIKLPWTFADEENWNRTHRLAGPIWVLCGALLCVNAFLKLTWLIAVVLVVGIGVPTVYSYWMYRRKKGNT